MRKIDKIILHCSDSTFGNASLIDEWHRERGFDNIGYHYVITKCGDIELGRDLGKAGAHCYGQNKYSIGICLIGKNTFTAKQLLEALPTLITTICNEYGLTLKDVYGHYEFNTGKTCPNIDMDLLKTYLKGKMI